MCLHFANRGITANTADDDKVLKYTDFAVKLAWCTSSGTIGAIAAFYLSEQYLVEL